MTYDYTKTCSSSHEIYRFGRPFIGHHCSIYEIFSLPDHCLPRSREKDAILTQTLQPYGWGVMKFTFLYPYLTDATYRIFFRLAQSF